MKMPHFIASLAVATLASAADLKDPAEVAREWEEQTVEPPVFSAPATLQGLTALPPPSSSGRLKLIPRVPRQNLVPDWGRIPRNRPYDAPDYQVPPVLPDNMPPGTKEWKYGGGTYYIVPLVPARDQ